MTSFFKDIRYGVRMLLKRPALTIAALLCLGLGIGSAITMFTLAYGMLFRPLPYEEPDRILWIMETAPKRGFDWLGIAYPNFRDWQEQNRSFDYMAAYYGTSLGLAGGEEPRRVQALVTSADMFRVLGVEPLMGRNFTPDNDLEGADRVMIISYALWQNQFGADPEIVGRSVIIHSDPHTIIGVMPAGFHYPEFTELWVPINRYSGIGRRGQHSLQAIGRLKEGVSEGQALADLRTIVRGLEEMYPEYLDDNDVRVVPLLEFVTEGFRGQLKILLYAGILVLLIACSNVANMLLATAIGRGREIAVRGTLGAGGARLVRQLMTESVILGLLGGLLGLGIGKLGIVVVLSLVPVDIPFWIDFSIDYVVVLVLIGVSVITGVIFGLAPVSQALRTNLVEALKEGGTRAAGGSRNFLRNSLVVGEVALALMLLVGAGLLIQGFFRLRQVEPGFDAQNLLAMDISLPNTHYPEGIQRRQFFISALEKLEALPGAVSAGAVLTLPMGGSNWGNSYSMEEFPVDPEEPLPVGNYRLLIGDYLNTMRIPLLSGRYFRPEEDVEGGDVVIINQALAEMFWPDSRPLGKRLTLGRGTSEDAQWFEIIGVAGDVRHRGLSREIRPGFYFPYGISTYHRMSLVVRTASDPYTMLQAVRDAIWSIDPTIPIHNLRPMADIVEESMWSEQIFVRLLSGVAALALVLAMLGVYGVMSYAVTERTREIGIRIAIGARPSRVVGFVVRQGMLLVLIGMVIGVVGALGVGMVLASLFYGVEAFEPLPLAGMTIFLMLVALLANYIPARRVSKQDPVSALRFE